MRYEYDGTFLGYMSAVYVGWKQGYGEIEDISSSKEGDLFGQVQFVPTKAEDGEKVLQALEKDCGSSVVRMVYYAFLREAPRRELCILRFLKLAFTVKRAIGQYVSLEPMWTVYEWAKAVGREQHRMLGLLRFMELDGGLLYAPFSSDYDVLPLLGTHFKNRIGQTKWAIHDRKRKMALYYDGKEISLVQIPVEAEDLFLGDGEKEIQRLWQSFYKTISIDERRKERLRQQHMPKKYWEYLTELQGS